jgi:hypothetical protein
VGRRGTDFFSFTEFVEEAASLLFIGGVPPFNKREPVGAAEPGHQNIPLALLLRAVLIAEARNPGGEMAVDLGAVIWGEGEAVEHSVAALVEPETQHVNWFAAGAKVGKEARAGLAVGALLSISWAMSTPPMWSRLRRLLHAS